VYRASAAKATTRGEQARQENRRVVDHPAVLSCDACLEGFSEKWIVHERFSVNSEPGTLYAA
jgi:hypothetical protein